MCTCPSLFLKQNANYWIFLLIDEQQDYQFDRHGPAQTSTEKSIENSGKPREILGQHGRNARKNHDKSREDDGYTAATGHR
jgi:hypothetical protein